MKRLLEGAKACLLARWPSNRAIAGARRRLRIGPLCVSALAICALAVSQAEARGPANAAPEGLDSSFMSKTVAVNGTSLHYVRGGKGPALVLIHGFPQDWFEYQLIMPRLAKRFTVVAVDLRGIGGSKATASGYDAANMADDVHQLIEALKLQHVYVVGHDLGGQVAYALARRHPQDLRGAMILDSTIPGVAGWDESMSGPAVWHVGFMQVPGLAEKLVAGRQAAYLGYFFSFSKFTPGQRAHYLKAYNMPAQLHAVFEMYRAFPLNVKANAAQRQPDDVPLVLATGAKSPFAAMTAKMAAGLQSVGFSHVETETIPGAVHYDVQDQPDATATLIERHAAPMPR
ncbi:MAG TPA: alpha/beta hydrolase [Allosphingosinicella sp.]|jgi:pimeloyl-ACP methyl ester carboxylesterase